MQTFKIVLVVGLVAGATAIGLAFAVALFRGTTVSGDEIVRHVILSFVVAAIAVVMARRIAKR